MKNSKYLAVAAALLIIGAGVYLYSEKTRIPFFASEPLSGRFVLEDATCAGFEFGSNASTVIWRNEIECGVSDTNPDYYEVQALYWLDDKTFVVKDIERPDQTSPPRTHIYIVESYDGTNLTLKSLWTGWGEYEFNVLKFVKK